MKVAMVNTYDLRGGAARAAWRLFEGLRAGGTDVRLLVQEKQSDDDDVVRVASPLSALLNPFRPYADFAVAFPMTRKRVLFSSALLPDRLPEAIAGLSPDIVHLHWVAGGFVRIESLAAISRPMVWTFHDMWPLTGGCHYTGECLAWQEICGKCPVLHSSSARDLSRSVFLRKQKAYAKIRDLVVTTPSRWMADRARESPLVANRRIEVVPNGLDTAFYAPRNKEEARNRLGLPPDRSVILFGAIRATQTPAKGFNLLVRALREMGRSDVLLAVFGSASAGTEDTSGLDIRYFGHVADASTLVDLYSAANVTAVPSIQEVFGQAATESMACGTPVAAFDSTGLRDVVVHRETGYLARPFEPGDLAAGLTWILEDPQRREALGQAARERAVSVYDISVVAATMARLYKEILHGRKG